MYAMNTDNIVDESIIEDISGSLDIFNAIGDSYGFKTMRNTTGRQPIFDQDQKDEDLVAEVTVDDKQMKQKIAQAKENIKIALKNTNMVLQDVREMNV